MSRYVNRVYPMQLTDSIARGHMFTELELATYEYVQSLDDVTAKRGLVLDYIAKHPEMATLTDQEYDNSYELLLSNLQYAVQTASQQLLRLSLAVVMEIHGDRK